MANVFRELTLSEAKALANREGKLVLIYFSSSRGTHRDSMERETWSDPRVAAWIATQTVALQFDLDQTKREAEILGVLAAPTITAWLEEQEIDRIFGCKSADELMAWFGTLRDGARLDERLAAEMAAIPRGGKDEVDARYALAKRLSHSPFAEEAANQFVWLWKNIATRQASMCGVRVSFMAGDMKRLAQARSSCRKTFESLRDELTPRATPGPEFDREAFDDWIVLTSRVLGDIATIKQWAESVSIPKTLIDERCDPFSDFRDELIQIHRWDLAAKLILDPLEVARRRRVFELGMEEHSRNAKHAVFKDPRHIEATSNSRHQEFSRLHVLALVLGSEKDAQSIADIALSLENTDAMRIAMVRLALYANQPREMHQTFLHACGEYPELLEKQLKASLAGP